MREVLQARLAQWGYSVRTASSVQQASQLVDSFAPHVVISDLVLPDATGIALLDSIRRGDPRRTVLLVTAYGTIDTAVQAIKAGAAEFLTKPLDYVALRKKLEAVEQVLAASTDEPGSGAFFGMVGKSPALLTLQEEIRVAARTDRPVLVVGESGSGKELVARTIAALSDRRDGPFVPVNAAAVPESLAEAEFFGVERGAFTGAHASRGGYFDEAHRGILFLDEVTEMPLALQSKFLRVLEDGQVRRVGARAPSARDVRVIAATNQSPELAVERGRFRADLYYRLGVFRLEVPPLRKRKSDIGALVLAFAREMASEQGRVEPEFEPEVFERLMAHDWPGNVRQLRNWVARALAQARDDRVLARDVDFGASEAASTVEAARGIVLPEGVTASEAERILILETLRSTNNNKAEAARRLGIDVKTIRNKLKAFDSDEAAG